MLRKSFFISLYGGLIVYLLLNLFWGNQGITALKELSRERILFEENLDYLIRENKNSQVHLSQLKNDRLSISLLARKIGYIKEGEKIIYSRIWEEHYGTSYDLPLLRTSRNRNVSKTNFIRILSLTIGLGLFVLGLILQWGQQGIRQIL